MKTSAILLSLLTVAIWGFNPAVAKLGMTELPPFAILSVRYLLTALFFLPFAKVCRGELKLLFLVAFFANVVNNGLCYIAFQYLRPAAATLLTQTEAPITVLMACLWGGEKITHFQLAGICIAFGGVTVVLGLPEISVFGALLILLSRVFWGICQLMFKNTRELKASAFIAYTALFALPFTALISWFCEPGALLQISQSWGSGLAAVTAFQVFALSFANVLWQKLIAANGVNRISPFVMTEIFFSALAGYLLFGNVITLRMGVGMLLILIGISLTSRKVFFTAFLQRVRRCK